MQPIERHMMKRLHGELGKAESRDLERRLAESPDLQACFHQLEKVWEDLEESPTTPLDSAFAMQTMERAQQAWGEPNWAAAPTWARASATLALTLGLTLGVTIAKVQTEVEAEIPGTLGQVSTVFEQESFEENPFAQPLGLAETWWRDLEERPLGEGDGFLAEGIDR